MTIIKNIEEITVYESPDGGKTIYSRKNNTQERTLIHKDVSIKDYDRWLKWQQILIASKDSPVLSLLIEQAELCYTLIKDKDNDVNRN